jgi:dTDP-3-amino-2,3,6-trideoxy-4-keto-D-glucose/dTDP-3-amino-3,4,6-trideoxy-alpha-D-glucose/dTDP-2,6-dideoxy-D-kanosamine transaminase
MIEYWNYLREYNSNKKILNAVNKVFKSGTLLLGNELKKFEKKYCKFNKSKFGLGVANGTDALYVALKCLNIGKGDEVITVSNTAIPTVAAIVNSGAKVKFTDIGKDFLIDTDKITRLINKKTKAIIPVHLFGQMCEMDKIIKIAKKYKLKIIEDCAQSTGATYKGKKAGTIGDVGCHSFYPTKILGAYGDGGFLTTNNKKLFEKMHRFRFYGIDTLGINKKWKNKYYSIDHGINSRLNEIQASILSLKLDNLSKSIEKRRQIAKRYFEELKNTNIDLPLVNKDNFHVFHIFEVAHKKRDLIIEKMKKKKINLSIHYQYPIHTMKAYKKFKNNSVLIETEKKSKIIFSLPIYPTLKKKEVDTIIKNLKNTVSQI